MKYLILVVLFAFSFQSWSLVEDHELSEAERKFLESVKEETLGQVSREKEIAQKNTLCLDNYKNYQIQNLKLSIEQFVDDCSFIIAGKKHDNNFDKIMSFIDDFVMKNQILNSTFRINAALYSLRLSPETFYNMRSIRPFKGLPAIYLSNEEKEIVTQQIFEDQKSINQEWENNFIIPLRLYSKEKSDEKKEEIERQLRTFVSERIQSNPDLINFNHPPLRQYYDKFLSIWKEKLMMAQLATLRLYIDDHKVIVYNQSANVTPESLIQSNQILIKHNDRFSFRIRSQSPDTRGFWGKVRYLYVPGQNLILTDFLNFKNAFSVVTNRSEENKKIAKNLIERIILDEKTLEGQLMSWMPLAPYIILGITTQVLGLSGAIVAPTIVSSLSSLIFVADASLFLIDSYYNMHYKKDMWASGATSLESYQNSLSRFYFASIVFGIGVSYMTSSVRSLSQNWNQISMSNFSKELVNSKSMTVKGNVNTSGKSTKGVTDYCLTASHSASKLISRILPAGALIEGTSNYLCYRGNWIMQRESSRVLVGFTDPSVFKFNGFTFIIAFARQVITYERIVYLEKMSKELSESI